MADLARAAGVSRPTLYQYFENRADLFRAAFDAFLNDSTDSALAALQDGGTVAECLDGYLQRAHGDAYEAVAATSFGAELMEDRHEFAADVATTAAGRANEGLRRFLEASTSTGPGSLATVVDLLSLAPVGLKADRPTTPIYRQRLRALAEAVASCWV
jgi:AcrR family transcriptional regulator